MNTGKSVVVIGGGPAGASAAIGLLRSGFSVTLLEQRTVWAGRVCGAFLSAEAVDHLKWLDLYQRAKVAGAVPVKSVFLSTSSRRKGTLYQFSEQGFGLSLSRHKLEDLLLNAVGENGGDVRMGRKVLSARREGNKWAVEAIVLVHNGKNPVPEREFFNPENVVFADGRFTMGMERQIDKRTGWFGWNSTFSGVGQKAGDLSLHFYPGGYVGMLTFQNGESNVCGLKFKSRNQNVIASDQRGRSNLMNNEIASSLNNAPRNDTNLTARDNVSHWEQVLEEVKSYSSHLKTILSGAKRLSPFLGVGPLPYSKAMNKNPEAPLAGDAAAVGDPFMGEGIGRALSSGFLIYQALNTTGESELGMRFLNNYEADWNKYYTPRLRTNSFLRKFLRYPPFVNIMLDPLFKQNWALDLLTAKSHSNAPSFPLPRE